MEYCANHIIPSCSHSLVGCRMQLARVAPLEALSNIFNIKFWHCLCSIEGSVFFYWRGSLQFIGSVSLHLNCIIYISSTIAPYCENGVTAWWIFPGQWAHACWLIQESVEWISCSPGLSLTAPNRMTQVPKFHSTCNFYDNDWYFLSKSSVFKLQAIQLP